MKKITTKNKIELLEALKELKGEEEVYISLRPTSDIIDHILANNLKIKKIVCPRSLYLQISKNTKEYLENVNIIVEPGNFKIGRPRKYHEDTLKYILAKYSEGVAPKNIAKELNIPLRTVYHYIKNGLDMPG
ncbi:MAG: helix-turn-helix domain-containing protein [archaeon]